MALSFTRHKTKHIFAKITKIWWLYFALTIVILLGFYSFVAREITVSTKRAQEYRASQQILQQSIIDIDEYFERLVFEATLVYQRSDKNNIRRDKLHNLLELIPDKITLHFIEISDTMLVLKGITPSKEFFYFALQDPLKANFGRSNVNFYALSNGWYEFTSISHAHTQATRKAESRAAIDDTE